jgi:hypothetical protein
MNPTQAKQPTETVRAEDHAPVMPILDQTIAATERKIAIEAQQQEFEYTQRLAKLFAKSGCFSDIKKNISEEQALAQAFTKIELGKCMGFSAAESMQGVHLISGTPSVNAQLRAARMQRAGFSWDIDWFDSKEGICEGCRLWLYRYGKPLLTVVRDADGNVVTDDNGDSITKQVSVSFLKRDAEILKTKIWEDGGSSRTASVLEKDNWKGSPRNMYFARAVTNAQRWHAPGVLSGEIPSTEEAMDFVDPDEEFKHGGSREAQEIVVNAKLAHYAMEKAREAKQAANDITKAEENGDGQKPEDAPEGETRAKDLASPDTVGTNREIPAVSGPGPKTSKPVFGRKP